jgi:hypothetical protein
MPKDIDDLTRGYSDSYLDELIVAYRDYGNGGYTQQVRLNELLIEKERRRPSIQEQIAARSREEVLSGIELEDLQAIVRHYRDRMSQSDDPAWIAHWNKKLTPAQTEIDRRAKEEGDRKLAAVRISDGGEGIGLSTEGFELVDDTNVYPWTVKTLSMTFENVPDSIISLVSGYSEEQLRGMRFDAIVKGDLVQRARLLREKIQRDLGDNSVPPLVIAHRKTIVSRFLAWLRR